MLNHETDVIGDSQNAKKKKNEQCHCPEFFPFLCHCHYVESFFQKPNTTEELVSGIRI